MAIDPQLRQVPDALKKRAQWLVWKFELKKDAVKPSKMPYYADGGRRVGTQGDDRDRSRLVSFGAAIRAGQQLGADGIGFAFLPDDGLIGIDIDGAIDLETGEISERAREIIAACNSYTELSPSKRGVHIYVEGFTKSFKSNDIGVEVFCSVQFFTVTGDVWPGSDREVRAISDEALASLQAMVDAAKGKKPAATPGPAPAPTASSGSGDDFRRVNEIAMGALHAWVPALFTGAVSRGDGFRVSSKSVGRDLQEDISIDPRGIVDFGVADSGDARQGRRTPIDLVMEWLPASKPKDALVWLARRVGYELSQSASRSAGPRPTAPQARDSLSEPTAMVRAQPAEPFDETSTRATADAREPFRGTEPDNPGEMPPFSAAETLQTPLVPDGKRADNTFDPTGFWEPELPEFFQKSKTGVKAVMHNLMLILRGHPQWQGVLAFDQYSELIMKVKAPPWQEGAFKPSEWSEVDDYRLRHWLSTWFFEAKEKDVMQAVTLVARENAFHPLIERIEAVPWDGACRLQTWLMVYLGVCQGKAFERLPTEEADRIRQYVEKAGMKWMVGAVGRVYEAAKPGAITGSQMDTMLILEGEQGLMKSSALRVLGGEWFTDEKLDFGNKDSFLILQGRWIIEMAELEGLNKADTSATKHFITKREDLFRAPYGRKLEKKPRRCAFAGTVNHDAYLKDDSGNRRFWPVTCTAIDIEKLRADVDQLWAEALHRYREGVKWWVEPDERELFKVEQDKRFQEDAWQEPIEDYLVGKTRVTVAELLEHALKLEKARWDKMSQMRCGSIVKRIGWLRRRLSVAGRQTWAYIHPGAEETTETVQRGDDDAPF